MTSIHLHKSLVLIHLAGTQPASLLQFNSLPLSMITESSTFSSHRCAYGVYSLTQVFGIDSSSRHPAVIATAVLPSEHSLQSGIVNGVIYFVASQTVYGLYIWPSLCLSTSRMCFEPSSLSVYACVVPAKVLPGPVLT